jgi:ABC-type multidrug transport system ATPase subunit
MGQPPLVSFNLAMTGNLLIEAQGLGKSFGNETAVVDIDMTVPAGTIFGFIGPSGCGKTTTVRLLNGSYKPTTGIDPILRQKLWAFFRQLRAEGQTLFVTTRYVGEAAFSDYVGMMADGRLLTVDTPEQSRRTAIGGDMIDIVLHEALPAARLYEFRAYELVQNRLLRNWALFGVKFLSF